MAGLHEILKQRERELAHQAVALRHQLAAVEKELAAVQKTIDFAATQLQPESESLRIPMVIDSTPDINSAEASATIKDLVVKALSGLKSAKPQDIIAFIRDVDRRQIDPSSLRPQLHRMKGEGLIFQDDEGRWQIGPEIVPDGRTSTSLSELDKQAEARRATVQKRLKLYRQLKGLKE